MSLLVKVKPKKKKDKKKAKIMQELLNWILSLPKEKWEEVINEVGGS